MIDVQPVIEFEGNSCLGYQAKGHVDKRKFAIALNKNYGLANEGRFAPESKVKHQYQRFIPCPGSDYHAGFMQVCEAGRGATKVTVIDFDDLGRIESRMQQ